MHTMFILRMKCKITDVPGALKFLLFKVSLMHQNHWQMHRIFFNLQLHAVLFSMSTIF